MDILAESTPEEKTPFDVFEFKNRVSKGDGTLIPLAQRSERDTTLFIAARLIGNPTLEDSPDAEKWFYGWEEEKVGIGAFTGVVIVDVYAEEADSIIPVGHMDWWLQGDYANGGGNIHGAAIPRNDHEKQALERWGGRWGQGDSTAFKLEPDYQKQRIGSLMLATSAAVLPSSGVTKFYSGGLLKPAVSTYARFGISPDDFTISDEEDSPHWMRQLPIERLAQNPHVDEVIEHFLQPD